MRPLQHIRYHVENMLAGALAAVRFHTCLYRRQKCRLAEHGLKSGWQREGVLCLLRMFCAVALL